VYLDEQLHELLAMGPSLGLHVVSIEHASP
jgi:hypothetical protein